MALEWLRKRRADGSERDCCPECEAEVDAALTYCTVCGYDIVRQARIDLAHPPHLA